MMPSNLRVGLGTDLHRLVEGKTLVLGGVKIPSNWGCDAHSDGDALLHAVIDALLGATHLGDIGEHFAPSDNQWKNADSSQLLKITLELIKTHIPNFRIVNLDAVVHLQAPKLMPYRTALESNLANLLGISANQVSIKAKTGEHLAPIGTHEAISTQVVLLCTL
jgi:2-C-methyl-D-erythritol 2,4-cyclodiphosphate synthase